MKVTIYPSPLKGTIHAPASKSSMQRACAAALLNKGRTIINNPGNSNDDKAALSIISQLGADVVDNKGEVIVDSKGFPFANELDANEKDAPLSIHCGESGLSIRMFTTIAALSKRQIRIDGEGSLLRRPMDFFDSVLPELGVRVESKNGKLPLLIQGPLQPANIDIDGSLSSQFLTGLLMAYGVFPTDPGKDAKRTDEVLATITVDNLKSKPYIDLTLDVMKKFGFNLPENRNYEKFIFYNRSGNQDSTEPKSYIVEGDWSAGAFLLVAGAIAGPVTVRGLDLTSTQADRAIIDALMAANAAVAIEAKGIKILSSEMDGFYFDANNCPDLFPPLVALAAYCKGKTTLRGLNRLVHKESNRALTLQDEFDKMGVTITFDGDDMIVEGGGIVKGADTHSHHDHRIAMACAVAALRAESETVIDEAQAVRKSYPDFYHDLKNLGASVTLPFQTIN